MTLSGSPSQSPLLPRQKRANSPSKSSHPVPRNKSLGRYVVTGQVGRGGMGVVYEAEDTRLKRKVAIKLLPKEVSTNPEALARFLREAQGAARLNHANVVAVYDLGETEGTYYIVMELIAGENAQEMLRTRGPFPWRAATSVLTAVCRGVAAAHTAGLIHRDIKPANILLANDGGVKLGDFGLVKPTGIKGTEVTALGEMVGTPHYMSPEQSRCNPLDERSDIYSLGATYFALLTARPPFNNPDSMQVLFAHCALPVPDPRTIVSDIPEACVSIIRRAMEKNRSHRYSSASELLTALEAVLSTESSPSVAVVPVRSDSRRVDLPDPLSFPDLPPVERTIIGRPAKWPRRRFIGLGFAGLMATVAPIAVFVSRRNRPVAPQPPEPALPIATDHWPNLAAEAEKAVRSRDPASLKTVLNEIQVFEKRSLPTDAARLGAMRQITARLVKSLAFRESITERGRVVGVDSQASCAIISPDDRWLAVGQGYGDAGACVFDSYTGEKRFTLWPRRGSSAASVQALAFDPSGESLAAACADSIIRVSHVATGKDTRFDAGPGVNRAMAVAFSPNSRTLVAGFDPIGEGKGKPYLKCWNLDTGQEPFAFKPEHSARVSCVAFCAGGHQIATGSHDKRIVMWNADTGRIWRELRTGLTIAALACSPHGRAIAVTGVDSDASVIQFWDYAGETRLATRPSPHGPCHGLAFSRDGSLLASGSGSRIVLWNPETFTPIATLTGHSQDVTAVAFAAEGGILLSGSRDQTARLWDVTRFLPTRSDA